MIGQDQTVDLAGFFQRHKSSKLRLDFVFRSSKTAVTKSMTAFITVKLCFDRLPGGCPDCIAMPDKVIAAICVSRNIVVAIACQAKQLCIFIEAVSSACVGNQREEILISKIVDPRKWSGRRCDHIFFLLVIKKSKFHVVFLQFVLNLCFRT